MLVRGCLAEDEEQKLFVDWIDRCAAWTRVFDNFTAVPHGGVRPSKIDAKGRRYSVEGQKLAEMGVRPGYPDLLLDLPVTPWHGLRVELKPTIGGVVSDVQAAWKARLSACGYVCEVCHGWRVTAGVFVRYVEPLVADKTAVRRMRQLIPAW